MNFLRKTKAGEGPQKAQLQYGVEVVAVHYLDGDRETSDKLTRDGSVRVKYSNGDRYEGDVATGKGGRIQKNGKGEYVFASGAKYDGEYLNDTKHGSGVYTTTSGDKFEGSFEKGIKHGPGKYTYANGDIFEGTWVKGKRHGPGKYYHANSKKQEIAEWKYGEVIETSRKLVESKPISGPSLIISGGPASGKGTQCQNIKEELGVVHLSTGDLLRAAVREGSEIGRKAKAYMDKGLLVPDEIMISIIEERLEKDDVKERGFLLDGFPRTAVQAKALSEMGVLVDTFLLLKVPDEIMVERVEGRRIDPETGRTYHIKFNPPPPELEDRLIQRNDDTREKIAVRIDDYHRNIRSVQEHYKEQMVEIDGSLDPESVWEQIKEALDISEKPLGIIISGAPASGKGTQAANLRDKHGVVHLSTGDMLRAAVKAGIAVGKEAKKYMDKGELVPDDIVIGAVKERLSQDDVKKNGFLLDGFPRTQAQAKALEEMGIDVDMFLLINVPDEKLIERVTGRRIDPETGDTYHVKFNPPPKEVEHRCITRTDDTEEKVRLRLEAYHGNISAIKEHYKEKLHEVNGDLHKDAVWEQVDEAINKVLDEKYEN